MSLQEVAPRAERRAKPEVEGVSATTKVEYGKSCSLFSNRWNYINSDRWGSVPCCKIWDSPGEITRRYSDRGEEWVVLFPGGNLYFDFGGADDFAEFNCPFLEKIKCGNLTQKKQNG